jgi:hypothetical protein
LLKGISISEQCYPEPHLRLMRDVDLLVAKESLSTITSAPTRTWLPAALR